MLHVLKVESANYFYVNPRAVTCSPEIFNVVAESGVCPGDDIDSINYDLRLVFLFTILNFFVIFYLSSLG